MLIENMTDDQLLDEIAERAKRSGSAKFSTDLDIMIQCWNELTRRKNLK